MNRRVIIIATVPFLYRLVNTRSRYAVFVADNRAHAAQLASALSGLTQTGIIVLGASSYRQGQTMTSDADTGFYFLVAGIKQGSESFYDWIESQMKPFDFVSALNDYAASLGVGVSELSEEDRRRAMIIAVLADDSYTPRRVRNGK